MSRPCLFCCDASVAEPDASSQSPRRGATAAWLTQNPAQDPGSDYGLQKRACRELMAEYSSRHGFDTRWAVIPGVLHSDPTWGGGTTEYALDAALSAVEGKPFRCPVPLSCPLPMIMAEDLVNGLLRLQDAPRAQLTEPEAGYAMAGFSFTAQQLLTLLTELCPAAGGGGSGTLVFEEHLDENAAAFARLWPDTISGEAAERDLGFMAKMGFEAGMRQIVEAHLSRQTTAAATL
eukprot:COSAG05_NODE_2295_length_3264_cov_2.986730_5_plen_234_part_00